MGGRGAFWGNSNILKYYRFKTDLRIGNIRLISPTNNKSASTPTLSRSSKAIYATLNRSKEVKQITVYNKKREKLYDIDLDHDHTNGEFPNGHIQYYSNGKRLNEYHHPTKQQIKLINQLFEGLGASDYEYQKRKH